MYSGAFPSFLHVSSPELFQSAYHLDPLATPAGATMTAALVVGGGVGEDEGASDKDDVGEDVALVGHEYT
jgi:hypothetical protein